MKSEMLHYVGGTYTTLFIQRHINQKLEQFLSLQMLQVHLSCKTTFKAENDRSADHPDLHTTQ
jgi:hypothetical protein